MYLRVAVTDRCNLRCTYCLPERARFARGGATAQELQRLMAAIVRAAGVRKIRFTGGEPTLCPDLQLHVRAAKLLVPTVGLTSNGVLLERQLPGLRAAGLDRLNISLDAVDPEEFRRVARRDRLAAVLGAIRTAKRLGFTPLKLNTVVTAGTDVVALARFASAEGVHLRFIELMEVGEARTAWRARHVPAEAVIGRLLAVGIRIEAAPGLDEPTSRICRVVGHDPDRHTIGFVTSVSRPFCATCDRIRLTSRGRLHTCLFAADGVDLLTSLRGRDRPRLDALICAAVAMKRPPARFSRQATMAAIGG